MRKLASIRKIKEILPIDGADKIELLIIDGWKVVAQKGLHKVGDNVVYCEIDSFLPVKPEFEFLRKTSFRTDSLGNEGFRLKSIKLRGQVSQGLVIPIREINVDLSKYDVGSDVTELLCITKWEPAIPASLSGEVVGPFPSYIKKTDEERCQNIENIEQVCKENTFTITEKLDGTSFTAFVKDGEFGVCGRNWQLKETKDNSLWKVARTLDLENKLKSLNKNIAIQGELIGEGIQKNLYKIKGQELHVFNIFDIDRYEYLTQDKMIELCDSFELNHVPVISTDVVLNITIDEILKMAEGKSELNKQQEREGIVFRSNDKDFSFKSISNKFLLKHE